MPHRYRRRAALVDDTLPWERDAVCRAFVAANPDGATLDRVAALFSLTRERVRQIEARALRKLREACVKEGLDLRDVLTPSSYDVYASVIDFTK